MFVIVIGKIKYLRYECSENCGDLMEESWGVVWVEYMVFLVRMIWYF